MKKVSSFLLILFLSVIVDVAVAGEAFILGIAPHSSPRVILEMYAPLRQFMEQRLGMPVEIVTAPNFDLFAQRALAQEFDLAITTGHQARLLQKDASYIPLLTYTADFKAVTLVLGSGPIQTPADLNGKNVLGLSPTSLVTLWGQHWLVQNHVVPENMNYVSASDSVAQLILAGEAAAGFTSLANFQKLNPETRGQLRILAESKPMAGRVYVLNNRRAAMIKSIETILWDFAKTADAKKYFTANNLGGYRKLTAEEMEEMDVYADETRKLLGMKQ